MQLVHFMYGVTETRSQTHNSKRAILDEIETLRKEKKQTLKLIN